MFFMYKDFKISFVVNFMYIRIVKVLYRERKSFFHLIFYTFIFPKNISCNDTFFNTIFYISKITLVNIQIKINFCPTIQILYSIKVLRYFIFSFFIGDI